MRTKHLTIMFTDIKGFTPFVSKSSRKELEKLLNVHEKLILPIFKKFKGKVIKTIGDSFLVIFHSPTDAVLCGIKIQEKLFKYNKNLPRDKKLEVRVAINSGEVSLKGKDVFGEPVNIAARLEGVTKAGEVYFTESVYLAMNKKEIPAVAIGYHRFKGIPEEIKVYKVLKKGFFKEKNRITRKKNLKKRTITLLKAAIVILIIALVSIHYLEQKKEEKSYQEVSSEVDRNINEVIKAFKENDSLKAKRGIDALRKLREEPSHPPYLETALTDLEKTYKEKFE